MKSWIFSIPALLALAATGNAQELLLSSAILPLQNCPPPPPPPDNPSPPSPPTFNPPPSGGTYNGPGDTGPSTPAPSGPKAPGNNPGRSGPTTPAPSGPSAPGNNGPATQGPSTQGPVLGGADLSAWSWWWAYNQHPYLDLKRKILDNGVVTGSDDFFLGVGTTGQQTYLAPSSQTIQERIGPALLAAIREEGGGARREGALISLGKIHPIYQPEGTTTFQILQEHLDDPQQRVADAAVFALGLMGDSSAARILLSLAGDQESGRQMIRRERVPARTRSLAAFALGQLVTSTENVDVRRYVVHGLAQILQGEKQATPDLHVACVTSMGFARLPQGPVKPALKKPRKDSSSLLYLESQIQFLSEILKDKKRQELVRAHAPKAIAILAQNADDRHQDLALDILLDGIDSGRKAPRLVRHGLVEAVGVLADSDQDELDARARRSLHGVVADGQPVDRGLALVALGLVSSRAGEGEGDPLDSFGAERNFLMKYFTRGKSNTRPWAALALGLQGHHVLDEGGELSGSTSRAVEATFEHTRSPIRSGAHALALGLRRELSSAPILIERLKEERDESLRAQIAIGLGLMGDKHAIEALEDAMEQAEQQPMLLRDSAIALAMLGQKSVVLDLVDVLRGGKNLYTMASAVTALGFVGDTRAVDPLIELLQSDDQQEEARGHAAMALGVICETNDLPWKAAFSNHLNYHAMASTLNNGDGTGILNFR